MKSENRERKKRESTKRHCYGDHGASIKFISMECGCVMIQSPSTSSDCDLQPSVLSVYVDAECQKVLRFNEQLTEFHSPVWDHADENSPGLH